MVRKVFAIASFLLLLMLVTVALDNYNRAWKSYQRQYFYQLTREKGGSLSPLDVLSTEAKLGTVKVVTEPGRSADLCMSCHINWGGTQAFADQPLADLTQEHPDFVLQDYPFDQYGCTACHGGKALALTPEKAHEGLRDAMALVFEQKVAELTAPDWLTRQHAIERIRWMTGQDFGYRQAAPRAEQQAVIERIQGWWRQHGDTFLSEGFGERTSPFKTENPLEEDITGQPALGPEGNKLRYVNNNACVSCHTLRTERRLEETRASGDEANVQLVQEQLDHLRLFSQLDLSDVTLADEEFSQLAQNYTCQLCHGPGEQYIKLMQKGYALTLQGDTTQSSEILKRAGEIARGNARANLSDPRVWKWIQVLIAQGQLSREALAGAQPPQPEAPAEATPSQPPAAPAGGEALIEQGRQLVQAKGCLGCHSVDGSTKVGPTFKGLFGKSEALDDGSAAVVDEAYLREAVLDPRAQLVEGFPPAMPPYPLGEEELAAVVAYLKSLSSLGAAGEPPAAAPAAAAVLIEQGQQLVQAKGCLGCHSVDGSAGVGPTLRGLVGKEEMLSDGTTVTVDEAYLREAVLDPRAQLVEGFPPAMPPYPLSEEELNALLAYLRSLAE